MINFKNIFLRKSEKSFRYCGDVSSIPIYIICFNRLSYLKILVERLESYGLNNIHIIDNCSSYPPLLEYLKNIPYKVHYMEKNYGHMVFFEAEEFRNVRENEYYVVTDPDVIPTEECPADFLAYFYYILQKCPNFTKVGFSLKLDDVPQNTPSWEMIRIWESQFYRKKLNKFKPYWYKAAIDTTFALYRPMKNLTMSNFYDAVRVGAPYEARHLPWYKDVTKQDLEDMFYNKTDCGSGNWNDEKGVEQAKSECISRLTEHWWENVFSVKNCKKRIVVRIMGLKITIKHYHCED